MLRRDLTAVRTQGRCIVTAGMLSDPCTPVHLPYTGDTAQFIKTDAAEVQVAHLYPLGLAWRYGGAATCPDWRRTPGCHPARLHSTGRSLGCVPGPLASRSTWSAQRTVLPTTIGYCRFELRVLWVKEDIG